MKQPTIEDAKQIRIRNFGLYWYLCKKVTISTYIINYAGSGARKRL